MRYIVVLLIITSLYSCDYLAVKKGNEQLKEEKIYSDSIMNAYKKKELQEELVGMMNKYAVYVIKYNQCKRWGSHQEESYNCLEWETFYRTGIIEVSVMLSEDDKYRILDEHSSLCYSDDYIISRELFVFDSYTEASKLNNNYKRKK